MQAHTSGKRGVALKLRVSTALVLNLSSMYPPHCIYDECEVEVVLRPAVQRCEERLAPITTSATVARICPSRRQRRSLNAAARTAKKGARMHAAVQDATPSSSWCPQIGRASRARRRTAKLFTYRFANVRPRSLRGASGQSALGTFFDSTPPPSPLFNSNCSRVPRCDAHDPLRAKLKSARQLVTSIVVRAVALLQFGLFSLVSSVWSPRFLYLIRPLLAPFVAAPASQTSVSNVQSIHSCRTHV